MDNQHRKIVGYRELSQEDIDLMNRVKAAGKVLLDLQAEVVQRVKDQTKMHMGAMTSAVENSPEEKQAELCYEAHMLAEPLRWAAIAKTDIQTGVMALVRSVAQPTDC